MAFCPDCGNQMSPDAETCPSCGKGIDQAAPPVEAAAPAPPAPPAAGMAPPPAAPPPPMAPPPMAPPPPGQAFAPPPPGAVPPMGMGQPGPAWPAPVMAKKKTSGMAIASLVVSILCCGPLGIIFGFVAKSQIKKSNGQLEGNGLATAGIIVGILSILVAIAGVVGGILLIGEITEPIDRTNEFINAVNAGDVDTAYDLLAPGTTTKAKLGDFVDEHQNSTRSHFAYASSINDDRAEVTVTFTDKDNYEYDEIFQLRNIDGEWKITYVPNW